MFFSPPVGSLGNLSLLDFFSRGLKQMEGMALDFGLVAFQHIWDASDPEMGKSFSVSLDLVAPSHPVP